MGRSQWSSGRASLQPICWLRSRVRIPVVTHSKAQVCSLSLAGIASSNPAGGMDVCVVCYT